MCIDVWSKTITHTHTCIYTHTHTYIPTYIHTGAVTIRGAVDAHLKDCALYGNVAGFGAALTVLDRYE